MQDNIEVPSVEQIQENTKSSIIKYMMGIIVILLGTIGVLFNSDNKLPAEERHTYIVRERELNDSIISLTKSKVKDMVEIELWKRRYMEKNDTLNAYKGRVRSDLYPKATKILGNER